VAVEIARKKEAAKRKKTENYFLEKVERGFEKKWDEK